MYLVICYSSRGRRDRQAKASCLPGVRALRARLTYPTNGVAEIDSQPAESEQYRGLRSLAGVGVHAGRGGGGLRGRAGVAGLAVAVDVGSSTPESARCHIDRGGPKQYRVRGAEVG